MDFLNNMDSGFVTVEGHVRSMPDGIEQNNLSYNGEDKMPPSSLTDVEAHIRTAPDGMIENNLSYHSPDYLNTGIHTVMDHPDPLSQIHKYQIEPLTFD